MTWTPIDIQHKHFRKRLLGLDPNEVRLALQQAADEIQQAKLENAALRKEVQDAKKELSKHREREKTIRNVLLSAHKAMDQMKANAEKEAKLIVADAELRAEKLLEGAHQQLSQLQEEITELKRQRMQLEMKLRSTIESYQQLLDMDKEKDTEDHVEGKVTLLNR